MYVGHLVWRFKLVGLLLVAFLSFNAVSNANVQVANLKQDLELVARELASLRTEVELLRRENAQLRVNFEEATRTAKAKNGGSQGQFLQLDSRIRNLENRISANTQSIQGLKSSFDKNLNDLVIKMNKNFDQIGSRSSSNSSTPVFSSDYPENGLVHKVEKGETVSSIAKKYNSKIKWIIDANQIPDPTKVFAGKELFVPQK